MMSDTGNYWRDRARAAEQHLTEQTEIWKGDRQRLHDLRETLTRIAEVMEGAPLGAETRYVTADTYASKALRMHSIARQALGGNG